jgi:hypothetical protein
LPSQRGSQRVSPIWRTSSGGDIWGSGGAGVLDDEWRKAWSKASRRVLK